MKTTTPFLLFSTLLPLAALGCSAESGAQSFDEAVQLSEHSEPLAGEILTCSGLSCLTSPVPLPHDVSEAKLWDPCRGAPFSFTARIDFEPGYDFLQINSVKYDGYNRQLSGSVQGPAWLQVFTDGSVSSRGVTQLTAVCQLPLSHFLEMENSRDRQGAYATTLTSRAGFSGSGYVLSADNDTDVAGSQDAAAFDFRSASADYDLYFRVYTNSNFDDDSLFYQVDQGEWIARNNLANLGNGWVWAKAERVVTLATGVHTLTIRNRENGLLIDKLALIPKGQPAPTGVGGAATNLPPPAITCGSLTCNNGNSCCDGNDSPATACAPGPTACLSAGLGQPIQCDSHQDCARGVCALISNLGNQGRITRCIGNDELGDFLSHGYLEQELCASPAGTATCPAGKVCGTANQLGYRYCQ